MNKIKLVIVIALLALCGACQQQGGTEKAPPLTPTDIQDWDSVLFGGFDPMKEDLRVRYKDDQWVIEYTDDTGDKPKTTVLGPYHGHHPFPDGMEYFPGDPKNDKDDRWIFEYLGDKGCTIKVFAKTDHTLQLINEHTVTDHNCQYGQPDTAAQEKSIYTSSYDSHTVGVLRINIATGKEVYSAKVPGSIENIGDIEVLKGKIIVITKQGDDTYISVYSSQGKLEQKMKVAGAYEGAMDDKGSSKIVVTSVEGVSRLMVVVVGPSGIKVTSPISSPGKLVDLQVHKFNGKTVYIATTYDAQANLTRITLVDGNGQKIQTHEMRGKFRAAHTSKNGLYKAFLTTDPPDNPGSGVTNVSLFDLKSGDEKNLTNRSVSGAPETPDDMTVDDNGTIRFTTHDEQGHQTSRVIKEVQ